MRKNAGMGWWGLLALCVILMFGIVALTSAIEAQAQPRTVSHDVVSTYTDNTPIEATKTVSYSVWYRDSVTGAVTQVSNKVSVVTHPFNDNVMVKGRLYNFYGQAFLNTGEQSANSPDYGWTVPLGVPKQIGGWMIQ